MAAPSLYAPNVTVDEVVAKLLAPGGLPKRNKKFTVDKMRNGTLACSSQDIEVEIRFAPDANEVRIFVVTT